MTMTLYWLSCGSCGGDTMSLLNAHCPDLTELLDMYAIELLWHPSLSTLNAQKHRELFRAIQDGEKPLDILCVEGAVIRGPGGTGLYDSIGARPKKDLVSALARRARYVLAVGTCAGFGGVGSTGEVEATGLQFHRWEKGGFLGGDFISSSGLPSSTCQDAPVTETC